LMVGGGYRAAGADGAAVGLVVSCAAAVVCPVIVPGVACVAVHLVSYGRVREYYTHGVSAEVLDKAQVQLSLACTRFGLPCVEDRLLAAELASAGSGVTPGVRSYALVGDRALSLACAVTGHGQRATVASAHAYSKRTENKVFHDYYQRKVADVYGGKTETPAATTVEAIVGAVFVAYGLAPVKQFMEAELHPEFGWTRGEW
jgi:hypothetical protein